MLQTIPQTSATSICMQGKCAHLAVRAEEGCLPGGICHHTVGLAGKRPTAGSTAPFPRVCSPPSCSSNP